jgi:hypothetical protein
MDFDIDGTTVTVPDEQVSKGASTLPNYNTEIDRIVDKRVGEFKNTQETTFAADRDALIATHSQELAEAKTLTTGSKSEKDNLLIQANTDMQNQINDLKNGLASEKLEGKKSSLRNDLTSGLSGVTDDLVRNSLIRNAMDTVIQGDDGSMYFKVEGGALISAGDMAKQYEATYPKHFKSDQPQGLGLTGGDLATGPNLLKAALGGDMASKMEYAKQHGMPAYLAEVAKAAVPQT